jgi:hypothetical protein
MLDLKPNIFFANWRFRLVLHFSSDFPSLLMESYWWTKDGKKIGLAVGRYWNNDD